MPYGGGYSDLSSKNNKLNRYDFIKKSKRGAILIEFAFAVPVLFSLIYYIHDLHRIKQIHNTLDFCAACAANMLQNISQGRNNKKITRYDCKYVACAAFHPYYGGTLKQYQQDDSFLPAGMMNIYYIEGKENNKAVIRWAVVAHRVMNPMDQNDYSNEVLTTNQSVYNYFNEKQFVIGAEYEQKYIHEDLQINVSETKIMLEIFFMGHHCRGGGGQKRLSPRFWGTILYSPPADILDGGNRNSFFHKYLIFTPKPGIFDPNNPPE